MGYSDLGCYGGEIATPTLDRLGRAGVRLSRFYNTTRCSPSRASMLTGLHPHQTGIGILTSDDRPHGYRGSLNDRCLTLAEILAAAGYATCLSGKWHLTSDVWNPSDAWPTRRGFERFFGTLSGCGSYYRPTTLMRTLPTGIYALLSSEFYGNYPILAASLVLFSVPVLLLYFAFQQQFVEGLTAGALKH